MSLSDPCCDAQWILETIIDDFAESLDGRDRARFYARLAQLVAERRDEEARSLTAADLPDAPQNLH